MMPFNLLFCLCLLILLSCGQEKTQEYCIQELSKSDSLDLKYGLAIDHPVIFRDSTFQMPPISSYDSVYWYRASAWGGFDYLCAVYNEAGAWKSDLVYQDEDNSRLPYMKVSRSFPPINLSRLRHSLDSLKIRCLPTLLDTIGGFSSSSIDAPSYDFVIKEGLNTWHYSWGTVCDPCEWSDRTAVREMFNLTYQRMLMPSGFPPPKLYFSEERTRDSVIFTYFYFMQDYPQIKQSQIVLDSIEIPLVHGLGTLKLPKNRLGKAMRVRAKVELIDGTVLLIAPIRRKEY